MTIKLRTVILLLLMVSSRYLIAQETEEELVQFTGIVVTADSLKPIPYTNIAIKNTWRGTVADYYGYFSFVAFKSDTLLFSAVGFKKGTFTIPDTLTGNRYSMIQVMASDTIMLTQTVIYPWPSKEKFKEAFLQYDVPDDDYERAKKNLDIAQLRDATTYYPMDGSMNFRNSMELYQNRLYYYGQTQPITILNPFAWAEFIKAWKEGKFKRKNNDSK